MPHEQTSINQEACIANDAASEAGLPPPSRGSLELAADAQPTCPGCGDATDEPTHDVGGELGVCRACYDASWTCQECQVRFFASDTRREYGDGVCQSCYDQHFFTCEGCCRVRSNDDYSQDGYCYDCDSSDDSEEESDGSGPEIGDYTRSYGSPVRTSDRGQMPTLYLCGAELEAEDGRADELADKLPDNIGLSEDGSLDEDTGVEIVTPPANGAALERIVRQACQAAHDAGYRVSPRCGLHVHVEYPRTEEACRRLFETVYAVEDLLLAMQPDSRLGNHYCKPLRRAYTFRSTGLPPHAFRLKWYGTDQDTDGKYQQTRYRGLNLHSVWIRGTAEFRYHAGSLNADKVLAWIRICQSLVSYARHRYEAAEVVRMLRAPGDALDRLPQAAALLRWEPDLVSYVTERILHFGRHRVLWGVVEQETEYPMERALGHFLGRTIQETRQRRRAEPPAWQVEEYPDVAGHLAVLEVA